MLALKLLLHFQPGAQFPLLGDVLMRGHPATIRHRINLTDNDLAIREFMDSRGWNDGASNALLDGLVRVGKYLKSQIQPVLDKFPDWTPGLYLLG